MVALMAHRHEAMLLWLINNPAGKQYECAKATGYSCWQISRIARSAEFKHRFDIVLDRRKQYLVKRVFE